MIQIITLISLGLLASCTSQVLDGRFDFTEILLTPTKAQPEDPEAQRVLTPPVVEIIKEVEEKPMEEIVEPRSWWGSV